MDVENWDNAYDAFFIRLGNGRDLATFRNSLRNTRDEFDYFTKYKKFTNEVYKYDVAVLPFVNGVL